MIPMYALYPGCPARIDLVFIVDASGSIRSGRFPLVLEFITAVVSEMEIGPDKAQVCSFCMFMYIVTGT